MTHELIANMLGVRREGVTEAGRSSPVRQKREANDAMCRLRQIVSLITEDRVTTGSICTSDRVSKWE
jgi:hypothetical protein